MDTYVDVNGNQHTIKYLHLREHEYFDGPISPRGGITIAYVDLFDEKLSQEEWKERSSLTRKTLMSFFSDKSNRENMAFTINIEELPNEVFFGKAVCSKKEAYSKKRGRIISRGRLLKKLYVVDSK